MRLRKNRRVKWTEEERQKLKSLFEKFDGDINKISKELRRGERSVRMNLFFMGLISEDEVDRNLLQLERSINLSHFHVIYSINELQSFDTMYSTVTETFPFPHYFITKNK